MFAAVSEKLQGALQRLGRKGRLTEKDIAEALREIRLALLEADVHFKVVQKCTDRIRLRALGAEVLRSVTPAQQVTRIVHEELVELLGQPGRLQLSAAPSVLMLVGLQGSGKTTTAAKVALHLRKQGQRPLLVPLDSARPAAVSQLQLLGQQVEVPVFGAPNGAAADWARAAMEEARRAGHGAVILDTAGRMVTDEPLLVELEQVKKAVAPAEVLLVADATTGQDALKVAEEFHRRLSLTGAILTKLDGDARGGAALSIREVTGVPIKFLGVGERPEALEVFHPDRLASRILGMGDVLSLVERAEEAVDRTRAAEMEKKLRAARFDLEDFLEQLRQLRRMGPLDQLLGMIPGLGRQLQGQVSASDADLKRLEAIILSMTPYERQHPEVIGGSRRRRIALGSGATVADVNQLLGRFRQLQQVLRTLSGGKRGADPFRFFQ